MSKALKSQREILEKFGIEKLNPMQLEANLAIHSAPEVVLLSPTGTGKTLAFLLPVIAEIDPKVEDIQVLILVPSRELAIQIEQVSREMGTGYKINAVYGGRSGTKDKLELKHPPKILVGTPGRVADHIRRNNINSKYIKTLVLDEFDKSLEVGFETEMSEICLSLRQVEKKILTSATQGVRIPAFVKMHNPIYVNYLDEKITEMKLKRFVSPDKDKLDTLVRALCYLGEQTGIVFCNFRDSIKRVSDFLMEHNIEHGTFHGGMEQQDRERALIKFRNGTHKVLLATDLAARGIDVPEIGFIIHYHLPHTNLEFTHRNGRTARMHQEGSAYVLHWVDERLPDFIPELEIEEIQEAPFPAPSKWETLFLSGGRKDKISKGDIAGLIFKQGGLDKGQVGQIELKQDCSFVAVEQSVADSLVENINNTKLKKKKLRVKRLY